MREKKMNKIIVIGCPGSGKSTFSRELHDIINIPIYYLDMLYWNEDKTTVDKPIFIQRLQQVIEQSSWIIDGNYASTMELRLQACDTVFFLDYSLDVCLEGIHERKGKKRDDLPWIEDDIDEEFIEFINNYHIHNRPQVMELLEKYHDKKIVIFNDRLQAHQFLESLRDKK